MIAIDTNVLLRYLLVDDNVQSKKATRLIDSNDSVYVSHVVLVEAIWTLKGKKYKLTPIQIEQTVTALFEQTNIVIQDDDLVWRALVDFRENAVDKNVNVDFPDALIFHLGKDAAEQYGESFGGFFSFDSNARKAFVEAKAP